MTDFAQGAERTAAPQSVREPGTPGSKSRRRIATRGDRRILQARLEVGDADDPCEREAEIVARQVLARLSADGTIGGATTSPSRIQRSADADQADTLDPEAERTLRSARGGGSPLAPGIQRDMSEAFGVDFERVRVHAGPEASKLNTRIHASAFTIGSDIFFRGAVPTGGDRRGRELLAHELVHVVQQGHAPPAANPETTRIRRTTAPDHIARRSEPDDRTSPPQGGSAPTRIRVRADRGPMVIRRGGVDPPPEDNYEHIRKIGSSDPYTIHYRRNRANNHFYVEPWISADGVPKRVGYVDIEPPDAHHVVTLHTNLDAAHRGIGTSLMPIALKIVADHHLGGGVVAVHLPMGGGAMVKLMIQKLSEKFGDPEKYSESEVVRKARKRAEEDEIENAPTKEAREQILQQRKNAVDTFDPKFSAEHRLQMEALLTTPAGQRMHFMSARGKVVNNLDPHAVGPEVDSRQYVQALANVPANRVTIPVDIFAAFARDLH